MIAASRRSAKARPWQAFCSFSVRLWDSCGEPLPCPGLVGMLWGYRERSACHPTRPAKNLEPIGGEMAQRHCQPAAETDTGTERRIWRGDRPGPRAQGRAQSVPVRRAALMAVGPDGQPTLISNPEAQADDDALAAKLDALAAVIRPKRGLLTDGLDRKVTTWSERL